MNDERVLDDTTLDRCVKIVGNLPYLGTLALRYTGHHGMLLS